MIILSPDQGAFLEQGPGEKAPLYHARRREDSHRYQRPEYKKVDMSHQPMRPLLLVVILRSITAEKYHKHDHSCLPCLPCRVTLVPQGCLFHRRPRLIIQGRGRLHHQLGFQPWPMVNLCNRANHLRPGLYHHRFPLRTLLQQVRTGNKRHRDRPQQDLEVGCHQNTSTMALVMAEVMVGPDGMERRHRSTRIGVKGPALTVTGAAEAMQGAEVGPEWIYSGSRMYVRIDR